MPLKKSVTDVARNFAEYINRVAYRGERFLLMRGGKPVAELRSPPSGARLDELPELLAGLPRLSPEDIEALASDLEQARKELERVPPKDPWAF